MLIADISDTSIEFLDFEKSHFGGYETKFATRIDIKEGEKLEDKLPQQFKNKSIAFTIPDSKVFIHRLQIPEGFIGPALLSTIFNKIGDVIPVQAENLVYDFTIIAADKKNKTQTVLFIASSKEIFLSYLLALQKYQIKPALILPESIAVFNIIKNEIKPDNAVLYIDIGSKNSTVSFFDTYGPISSFTEPVETVKLEEEILKVMEFFKKKYSEKIEKIILGGGGSINTNLEEFQKIIKLPVVKAEQLLQTKLNNLKIKVSTGDTPLIIYLNVISLGILANQETTLNLAKRDILENMNIKITNIKIKGETQNEVTQVNKNELYKNNDTFLDAPTDGETHEKPNKSRMLILLFVLIALMGITFFSIYNKKFGNKDGSSKIPVLKTILPSPSKIPTSAKPLSPTPANIIDKADVKIQVLNGTSVRGLAGKTSEYLKEKGYKNIDTGNADNFSYTKTQIRIKNDKKEYLDTVINDLKEDYKIGETYSDLENSSEYDVIIIIGQ